MGLSKICSCKDGEISKNKTDIHTYGYFTLEINHLFSAKAPVFCIPGRNLAGESSQQSNVVFMEFLSGLQHIAAKIPMFNEWQVKCDLQVLYLYAN